MAKEVGLASRAVRPASDIIFRDRRNPGAERRTRSKSAAEAGSFVNCRRDHEQDRRKRVSLIGHESWWLKINYVDWESGTSKIKP